MYSLDEDESADNLLGRSHGRFSCATSDPSRRNQDTIKAMRPSFRLYNPSGVIHFSQSTTDWLVHRRTSYSG